MRGRAQSGMPGQERPAVPRDAGAIAALLKDMGVEKYDASVVHMLLDVVHAHVGDLLISALAVAEHAGHSEIGLEDLQLAADAQRSYAEPLPRTAILSLARERNAVPLPLMAPHLDGPEGGDLPLPPPAQQLCPQRGIEIELPPAVHAPRKDAKTPWTVTREEERAIELVQQRNRSAAIALTTSATPQSVARPSPVARRRATTDIANATLATPSPQAVALPQAPLAPTFSTPKAEIAMLPPTQAKKQ
jgi:histone H3/H4